VDADAGEADLSPGQVGEIIIRAPRSWSATGKAPPKRRSMIRNGWVYTGDLGYLDEDGYLSSSTAKGPDQARRLPGLAAGDRGGHRYPPRCGRGKRGRRADEYRAKWASLDRPPSRPQSHCRRNQSTCRGKLRYKVPKHIEFRDGLPKTRSARCCGASWWRRNQGAHETCSAACGAAAFLRPERLRAGRAGGAAASSSRHSAGGHGLDSLQ